MSKVDEETEAPPSGIRQRLMNDKTSNGQINQDSNKLLKVSKRKRTISEVEYQKMRSAERKQRDILVLWWKPLITLQYFCFEAATLLYLGILRLWQRKKTVALVLFVFVLMIYFYQVPGPHQKFIGILKKNMLWWGYWLGLGILSSVGFGTGLHTFLIYLGPHIAGVTIAAYECMSVDFPEPPYPNEIVCPETQMASISIWTIISKVRFEAVMWGAGTAIGELPPYFMARAARLSGSDMEEDEFGEIEELIQEKNKHPGDLNFLERAKLAVHSLVQRVGFFGILACASIPNPLFDLAGITCGHFLIPFWTFFGATLIGKAIIKMHIQKLFVIFLFSEHHVEHIVHLIKYIPKFGPSLQVPFKEWLQHQKLKLHHKLGTSVIQDASWLAWVFEKVVMLMIAYFILSIINSMAQSYHKRCCKEKHSLLHKVAKE